MLGQALHGREQAEELDEADLFDAAGDVEPASRTGLYPIGAEGEGEETSDSDDAVDELGEFDDIPTLHTPPNPELRPGRAFAMSMPRERVRAWDRPPRVFTDELPSEMIPRLPSAGKAAHATFAFGCARRED